MGHHAVEIAAFEGAYIEKAWAYQDTSAEASQESVEAYPAVEAFQAIAVAY